MRIRNAKRTGQPHRKIWVALVCTTVAASVLVAPSVSARKIVPQPYDASPHSRVASQHWTWPRAGGNTYDGPKFTLHDLDQSGDPNHYYYVADVTFNRSDDEGDVMTIRLDKENIESGDITEGVYLPKGFSERFIAELQWLDNGGYAGFSRYQLREFNGSHPSDPDFETNTEYGGWDKDAERYVLKYQDWDTKSTWPVFERLPVFCCNANLLLRYVTPPEPPRPATNSAWPVTLVDSDLTLTENTTETTWTHSDDLSFTLQDVNYTIDSLVLDEDGDKDALYIELNETTSDPDVEDTLFPEEVIDGLWVELSFTDEDNVEQNVTYQFHEFTGWDPSHQMYMENSFFGGWSSTDKRYELTHYDFLGKPVNWAAPTGTVNFKLRYQHPAPKPPSSRDNNWVTLADTELTLTEDTANSTWTHSTDLDFSLDYVNYTIDYLSFDKSSTDDVFVVRMNETSSDPDVEGAYFHEDIIGDLVAVLQFTDADGTTHDIRYQFQGYSGDHPSDTGFETDTERGGWDSSDKRYELKYNDYLEDPISWAAPTGTVKFKLLYLYPESCITGVRDVKYTNHKEYNRMFSPDKPDGWTEFIPQMRFWIHGPSSLGDYKWDWDWDKFHLQYWRTPDQPDQMDDAYMIDEFFDVDKGYHTNRHGVEVVAFWNTYRVTLTKPYDLGAYYGNPSLDGETWQFEKGVRYTYRARHLNSEGYWGNWWQRDLFVPMPGPSAPSDPGGALDFWHTEPANRDAITGIEVQYREGCSSNNTWNSTTHAVTGDSIIETQNSSYKVRHSEGLQEGSRYDIRTRTVWGAPISDTGDWSETQCSPEVKTTPCPVQLAHRR